jgi:glycosyltransferase involved in cell wall biosynthesis
MDDANDAPLVSVIMIFLNAERFIGEAIDSVLRQTYPHWELLLVDDGSTDASTSIAKCYVAERPNRVRYLEHPGHVNRGMSATRNLGVRNSTGELIAFLDSDDVWMPQKLEQQVAIMLAHPKIGMVCGAAKYWTSWSEALSRDRPDCVVYTGAPQDQVSYPPSLLLQLSPLGKGASPCQGDFIVRREIFDKVGGFEDRFVGAYEDHAFLAKVYLVTPIYVSSTTLMWYRRHPDSCMSVVSREGKRQAALREFLEWLDRYLMEQRILTPTILSALRRARWPHKSRLHLWIWSKWGAMQSRLSPMLALAHRRHKESSPRMKHRCRR